MSSNPYPDTTGLFSEDYYQRNTRPPLQPDYGEYDPATALKIEREFYRLSEALNIDPRKLLTYGMVTAIKRGYAAGVIEGGSK